MRNLQIEDREIPYEVNKSKKASRARIDIDPSGVKVVVPEGSSIQPEEFIERRRDWVLKHYEEVQEILARMPDRDFKEGEKFPYLGEDHELVFKDIESSEIKEGEIRLPHEKVNNNSPEEILENFLREKARANIHSVIDQYIDEIEGDFDKVYIRNQKTKWGSCSGKSNLSFNFRLIMAPPEVLEYVVVHELVHLEEPEHSKAFWRKVSDILPDYEKRRKWLKENKMKLVMKREDL